MKEPVDDTTPLLEFEDLSISDPPKFLVNRFDGPKPLDVSKVWINNKAKPKTLKSATLICQPRRGLSYRPHSPHPTTITVDYFSTGLQRRRNERGLLSPGPSPTLHASQNYAVLFRVHPTAPIQIRHSPGRWENGEAEVGYVLMPLKRGIGAWLAHIGLGFYIQPRDEDLSFKISAQLYYKKTKTLYIPVVDDKSKPHCWELECNPWKPVRKKGGVL